MINSIIRQWKKDTENDLSKNKLSSAFSIWAHNVVDFFPWTIMSFCRGKAKLYLSNDKKQSRKTQKKRKKNNLSLSPSLIPMHIVQTKIELFPITSIQNEWLGKTVHNFNGIILCARFLFCVSSNFSKQMKIGSEVDAKNQNVLF